MSTRHQLFVKDVINQIGNLDKSIELEITNHCNAMCAMCPRDKITRPKGTMNIKTLKQLIKRCEEFKISDISIGGLGEPLVHVKFFGYLDLISKLDNIKITLTTNGLLFTPETQKKLLTYPVYEISLSFNGCDRNTYKNIMGIDYDRVVANIENFIENHPKDIRRLRIAIVKNKMNKAEVEDIIKMWRNKGLTKFIVLKAHNRAGYLTDNKIIDDNFYKDEKIEISDSLKKHCKKASLIFKFIDWQGGIHICCNDFQSKALMGDIFNHSFTEIESRREKIFNSIQNIFCKDCNMPSTLLYTELIRYEL
jgi:MoaA/NifB/PqqE/SkfB family radical SAM enzyme